MLQNVIFEGERTQVEAGRMIDAYAYDFAEEKEFHYSGLSEDAFVVHFASFISGLWQIHPFREGNTRTVAVFAIKYLRSMRYDVANALFKEKSWYFRNALVRANYENPKQDVEKTQRPLVDFFKVLVYGHDIELRNRFLHIDYEESSQKLSLRNNIQRHDVVINDVIKIAEKKGETCTEIEVQAIKALLRDPHLSAVRLGKVVGLTARQAQRVIASLKVKVGLKRSGSNKTGCWVFEC